MLTKSFLISSKNWNR